LCLAGNLSKKDGSNSNRIEPIKARVWLLVVAVFVTLMIDITQMLYTKIGVCDALYKEMCGK